MSVSESFRVLVIDQLTRALPRLRAKKFFGGVGIYSDGLFFALIADDVLYFKTDDANRSQYVERAMEPFLPFGKDGAVIQYFQLPDEILEDIDDLRRWSEASIAVAARKANAKRKRTPRPAATTKSNRSHFGL